MIELPDKYNVKSPYNFNQGTTLTCYAFASTFALLTKAYELTGEKLTLDPLEVAEDVKTEWSRQSKKGIRKLREVTFCDIGSRKGWITEEGKKIKILTWRRINFHNLNVIANSIYKYGPLIWNIKKPADLKLAPKETVLSSSKMKKPIGGHVMALIGFDMYSYDDYDRLFTFQNSWKRKDRNIRKIRWPDFKALTTSVIAIDRIEIT